MALTKSSVLHYFSSRYGIVPRVGGDPVFSRNSAGTFDAQHGLISTAIVNTPRWSWQTLQLPNGLTERRRLLTLELARSNALVAPSDFSNAAWTKSSTTVTTGIADPMGGTSACTLTATGASGITRQDLSNGSSIARTGSMWVRRRTGSGVVRLFNYGTGISLGLTSDWQRFKVPGPSIIQRTLLLEIITSGDAVDVWLGQLEDGAFATSGIVAGSGASRAADHLYWNFPQAVQAMIGYVRLVESGNIAGSSGRPFWIGPSGSTPPVFGTYVLSGFYTVYHNNNTGGSVQVSLGSAPATGDTVELVPMLYTDGHVRVIQSINGAAVSDSGSSSAATLAAAWGGPRIYMNSDADSGEVGSSKNAEMKLVKYADVVASTAQGIMDEMRAFELGPNSEVL